MRLFGATDYLFWFCTGSSRIKLSFQPNASLTTDSVRPLYILFNDFDFIPSKTLASSWCKPSSICINMVSFCVFVRSLSAPLTKCHNLFASFLNRPCSVPTGASLAIYGGSPSGKSHIILGSNAPFKTCLRGALAFCYNIAIFFGLSFALLTFVKISDIS